MRRTATRGWALYAGLVALVCAGYLAGPLRASWLFNVVGLSAAVAVVVGARINLAGGRLPWYLLAAAQALFVAGDVLAYHHEGLFGVPLPYPSVADAAYLAVYPCLAAGLLLLVARRTPGADRASLIDSLAVTIGVGAFSWSFLMAPYALDRELGTAAKLISLAYPAMDLLLLAVAVRLAVGAGRRGAAFHLLVVGIVALLATDAVYGWKLLHGGYETPGALDIGWMAFYALLGAAALHPSSALLSTRVRANDPRLTPRRLALLAAAAVAAPIAQAVALVAGHEVDGVLVGASVALFLLVLARLAGLVRAQEASRLNEAILAEAVAILDDPHLERLSLTGTLALDRKRILEALRESRQRVAAVLDNLPAFVVVLDAEGRCVLANQAAARALRRPVSALLGTTLRDALSPDAAETMEEHNRQALAAGRPLQFDEHLRAGDEVLRMLTVRVPLADGGICVVSTDITARVRDQDEKRDLEHALAHSQRMESLGRLAGGVAHDFNNLLAVILNYADFLAEELEDREALLDDVREISRAAQRAATLTRQLLVFSRRDATQPRALDVDEAIAGTLALLRRTLPADVTLDLRPARSPAIVRMDPGQLDQVLMNLVINAADAADGPLAIRIATSATELGPGAAGRAGVAPGPYVRVSIEDDGTGMPAEVAERAFEPFFTTKEKGRGTGLGLATVYGIVTGAGGHVTLSSTPGQGTVVSLYLPAAPGAAPAVKAVGPVTRSAGGRVLIAEDEEGVRELARRILAREGYDVVVAADGGQALAVHGELDPAPDLLLSDVVMPGMSGKELAEALRAVRPALPVVFMSGYTADVMVGYGHAGDELVHKPFDAATLLAAVARALPAPAPAT